MADLTRALAAHDIAATRAALSSLLAVLPELNASDRAQLGPAVHQLIAEAEIFLAGEPAQSSKDERAAPNSHRSSHGGGVEDSGQPTGASRDEANEHESTDGQGSGQSNTASTGSPATGGEGVSEGSEATSGSATSGGSDGDGVDGGGAVTPVPSGSPTTVGTTGSDGGSGGQTDGSDGSGATTTPTSNETSGSDGSGSSDGSTSGSDGDVVGETPR
jgi:hypothetical protein